MYASYIERGKEYENKRSMKANESMYIQSPTMNFRYYS